MSSSPRKLAYQRARNAANKAAGLCKCGQPPAPERKSCAKCLKHDAASANRRYAKKSAEILQDLRDDRANNPEKYAAYGRVSRARLKADPARLAAARQADRECAYRRKFGLSSAEVEGMRAGQNGRCAVCSIDFAEAYGKGEQGFHVDHCHRSGKVRALLCMRCNLACGHIESLGADGLLSALWSYIVRHRGTP